MFFLGNSGTFHLEKAFFVRLNMMRSYFYPFIIIKDYYYSFISFLFKILFPLESNNLNIREQYLPLHSIWTITSSSLPLLTSFPLYKQSTSPVQYTYINIKTLQLNRFKNITERMYRTKSNFDHRKPFIKRHHQNVTSCHHHSKLT